MNRLYWVIILVVVIVAVSVGFWFMTPEVTEDINSAAITTNVNKATGASLLGDEESIIDDTSDLENVSADDAIDDLSTLETELDIPEIDLDISLE